MVNQSLTREFELKLKCVVEKFESTTPIEIVPVIVKQASRYTAWSLVYGLLLGYFFSKAVAYLNNTWAHVLPIMEVLSFLIFSILISFLLRKSSIFTLLVPADLKHERCLQMAESLFLTESVGETKSRLGVLIAVFEFERKVIVLADRGFAPQVKSEYWSNLGALLARDFDRSKVGDEFFKALEVLEREIAPRFASKEENPNEISDDLRRR